MVQTGFHTIHFSPMFGAAASVVEVIRLTGAAGFDAIGVDAASVQAHGAVDEVAGAISDAGLVCSDVLVLMAGADEALPTTARALGRLASALGAPACIAAIAAPVAPEVLVPSLGECASILADHGCRLAVEFIPYGPLPSLADAAALCDAIGWDRCGLVLDSLHFCRSGSGWDDLSALAAEQIAVVQWSDVPAAPPESLAEESRHGRLLPGEGELPLGDLAAAIRATGWDGIATAEILSDDFRLTAPEIAIPAAHAAMASPAAGWRRADESAAATSEAG